MDGAQKEEDQDLPRESYVWCVVEVATSQDRDQNLRTTFMAEICQKGSNAV